MSHERDQAPEQDQARGDKDGGEQNGAAPSRGRSIAEWTTLGISIVIVLVVVGVITSLYAGGDAQPPVISVEPRLGAVRQDTGGYYLPVDVTNTGDQTAQDVQIEGELDAGSGAPEMAEFTITFLAGGEQVQATLVFQSDPEQGQLTTRVTSFQDP